MRYSFAIALCLALRAHAAQDVRVVPSTIPGVDITSTAAPDPAINEFFGPSRSAALIDWLPYGVAIANHTSQTIVALAIRWNFQGEPHRIPGAGLPHAAFDQPGRQLAPGKMAVAIPRTVLLDGLHLPPFLQVSPAFPQRPDGGLQLFRNPQGMEISLDGVVFASGQFVGPDAGRYFDWFTASISVPFQIASQVLAKRSAGDSTASIAAWLQTLADQRVSSKMVDWGVATFEAGTAGDLLRAYKDRGESALYQAAQYFQPPLQIHLYR